MTGKLVGTTLNSFWEPVVSAAQKVDHQQMTKNKKTQRLEG